ncbi:MAG: hypothetical protein PWR02_977 [Synergistales bacterium]|nr:hypothetical protein [Synergistales bacterium]
MNIDERLRQLEQEIGKQKRRNRGLLAAVAALAVAMIFIFALMGPLGGAEAESNGQVVAREIILVDDEGNARLKLGASQDQPGLALLGRDGSPLAVFAAHGDGSFLVLNNSMGKTRFILSVDSDGAGLNIFDESDVVRAAMAHMNENPVPDLNLYDKDGEIIWSALGE